mgnify:CR=1 FL=1
MEGELRRIGAMTALLASIVYTVLATWHGVLMQSPMAQPASSKADFERALTSAICHAAGAGQTFEPDTLPARPVAPGQAADCLVCKGMASCQVLVLVTAELWLAAPVLSTVAFALTHEAGPDRVGVTPRSRGPPGHA